MDEDPGRRGFVNITREVQQAVTESGVQEGLVLVNAMHITASVFINNQAACIRILTAGWKAWLRMRL